ncbi:hypothetical protein jhhlp_004887 [Lomentospora prolificans]|uniref:Alpha/beta hydrolase fold-3 domain-containing protein n=1 Tax=Lomentospora prolificans TaxID=41688 RepID=A0A2N3N7T2_9PEZI|nr:hypothetical protein jhhlp_004887 [Lomentospora prolificans]
MADFSCYGGPSQEWLALAATLPPPPPADQPILEKRKVINEGREAIAAEAMKTLASKVTIKDYAIPTRDGHTIEGRTYRPVSVDEQEVLPLYIHFHGGGYFFGTLASEDAICSRIALGAQVIVLNVNYRHTPEYVYPTAWNDGQDAYEWVHGNIKELGTDPQKVVIGGISAGAHITSSLTLQRRLGKACVTCPEPAGQVLMIPCVVSMYCYEPQLKKMKDPSISSYKENENAPILPMKVCKFFSDLLKIENPQVDDLKLNPGNATPEQVKGLPPTVFGITGLDPLRDEGLLYAKMLAEAGVPTDISLFKGVPHGFRRHGSLTASARWDRVMEDGIKWALSKPTATYKFDVKAE